jgi:ABC-type glycerol-3-phosphate transport system substrate-binding protein
MEIIDLGNSDASESYKAKIASDDLPEIVQTWSFTPLLADGGYLVPIRDGFYDKYGITKPAPYKGKWYTSQSGTQIMGIAVNRDLCAKAGVTQPPATWGELTADLDKIKAAGIQPIAYGGKEWSAGQFLGYLLQMSLYSKPENPSWTKRRDSGAITFANDPNAKACIQAAIDFLTKYAQKGALSDGYNEEQRDFYGGKAAMWLMGCWIGGDIEPNKVAFNVDYWPIPSLNSGPPKFLACNLQNGWAVTTKAKGEALNKSFAVLDAFYQPDVYQLFVNAEAMFPQASKVAVSGPKSDWKPAQHLYDSMAANFKKYGGITGELIALDDQWPDSFGGTLTRVAQEILSGNTDQQKLLQMMDDDWDSARKAN